MNHRRDSPFVKTNNSGGGFGKLNNAFLRHTQLEMLSAKLLRLAAVGDMDLLFMRTTRYESEESSGEPSASLPNILCMLEL